MSAENTDVLPVIPEKQGYPTGVNFLHSQFYGAGMSRCLLCIESFVISTLDHLTARRNRDLMRYPINEFIPVT